MPNMHMKERPNPYKHWQLQARMYLGARNAFDHSSSSSSSVHLKYCMKHVRTRCRICGLLSGDLLPTLTPWPALVRIHNLIDQSKPRLQSSTRSKCSIARSMASDKHCALCSCLGAATIATFLLREDLCGLVVWQSSMRDARSI
jgi:hypothetical protein